MKILKFIGLLFPSLALCSCVPNVVTTPVVSNNATFKSAISFDSLTSYVNSNNEVVITDFNFTFRSLFFNFCHDFMPANSSWQFSSMFFYCDNARGTHRATRVVIPPNNNVYILGNDGSDVFAIDKANNYSLDNFANLTKLYFPLNSTYDFGSYYLDYLRINDTSNVFDIVNGGFHHNYLYQLDIIKFTNLYNELIQYYSTVNFNYYNSDMSIGTYDELSNGTFYYREDYSTYVDLPTTLDFPFSCSLGDLRYSTNANNGIAHNFYDSYIALPSYSRSFFNFTTFNQSLGLVYYFNSSSNPTISTYPNFSLSSLYRYNGSGGRYTANELYLNKRYVYFVCDNPYLFNGLYYNIDSTTDNNPNGATFTGKFSPYLGYFRLPYLQRYGNYQSSNFITDLYFAYLKSFTCFGYFDSSVLPFTTAQFKCFYNNGDISSYQSAELGIGIDLNLTLLNDNGTYYYYFGDSNYRYLDIYLYSFFDKSYLNIPSNYSLVYPFTNYSLVTTIFGTCIRLDTSNPYTLKDLPFILSFNGYSYSLNISYFGYSEYTSIPLADTGDFYDYFFAIYDSPLYMVSQFLVVPFNFDILALLVALIGLAFVMFIIRLVV